MTHTSPEREELVDAIYNVPAFITLADAEKIADALQKLGYRRLPIDQARVGEIRERHQKADDASTWDWLEKYGAQAHYDRAYLLSLLDDTKVVEGAAALALTWLPIGEENKDGHMHWVSYDGPQPCFYRDGALAKYYLGMWRWGSGEPVLPHPTLCQRLIAPSPPHDGAHAVADTATPAIAPRTAEGEG